MTSSLKESVKLLYASWCINLDEVTIEQLDHYIAVENFLTDDDELPSDVENLDKVRGYLEAFYHLCDVADWERAYSLYSANEFTSSGNQLNVQLHTWDYYKEDIELCKQLLGKLNETREAVLMSSLGNAYSLLSEYQTAIEYNQKSLGIFTRLGNRENESIGLGNLGSVYNNQGDLKKAEEYYKKSLAIASCYPSLRHQTASMIGGLGVIYSVLGEFEKAIEKLEDQLKLSFDLDDKEMQADALKGLGTAYRSKGDPQKGIQYSEQALLIHEKLGGLLGQAHSLDNIGVAYKNLKEYQRAIDYQKKSLAISRQIGNLRGEAKTLCNLGICHKNLGEYKVAIDYQEQSVAISKSIGIQDQEARAIYEIGTTYGLMGQIDKATLFSMKALLIYDSIDHPLAKRVIDERFVPLVVHFGMTAKEIVLSLSSQLQEIVAEYDNEAADRIIHLLNNIIVE